MQKIIENNPHRGRPKESPLSESERLAITILMYGLENRLKNEGRLDIDIAKMRASSWETLKQLIKDRVGRNQKRDTCNNDSDELGKIDFFKNLRRIMNGEDKCKRPYQKSLDILVQYVFEGIGWKWTDFYKIFELYNNQHGVIFANPNDIEVPKLEINQCFLIGWIPQHFYFLKYLGNYEFKILVAGDGMQYDAGAEICAESFGITYPTIESINGRSFPAYAPPCLSFIHHVKEEF